MAATLKDMLAMENHAVDIPWWDSLVTGPSKPIVDHGFITVPDTPGLGVELNEEAVKEHIRKGRLLRAHAAVRRLHSRPLPHRRPVPASG